MKGWHTQIGSEYEVPKGSIGVVVAQKFPEPELIRIKLEEGIARVHPDTVWVLREAVKKDHAVSYAWQVFKSNGITPLLAPLNPFWKVKARTWSDVWAGHDPDAWPYPALDLRAKQRDIEMRNTLERIIVFHDTSSNVTKDWVDYCAEKKANQGDGSHCAARIFVVERGKARVKRYTKRTVEA